jgi:hypothetical protein
LLKQNSAEKYEFNLYTKIKPETEIEISICYCIYKHIKFSTDPCECTNIFLVYINTHKYKYNNKREITHHHLLTRIHLVHDHLSPFITGQPPENYNIQIEPESS